MASNKSVNEFYAPHVLKVYFIRKYVTNQFKETNHVFIQLNTISWNEENLL